MNVSMQSVSNTSIVLRGNKLAGETNARGLFGHASAYAYSNDSFVCVRWYVLLYIDYEEYICPMYYRGGGGVSTSILHMEGRRPT